MAVSVVFETHATSTHNEAGIASGWLPGELSSTGRRQAQELGTRRRDDGIAAVYTSDLRRAVETAEIAFAGSSIPVIQDRRLRECSYGRLDGGPAAAVAAVRLRHLDEPFPGGQSYRQVVEQTRDILAMLARRWDNQRVCIIAHSANRWALEHLLHGRPLEALASERVAWQPGWEYILPDGWHG